MSDRRSRLQRGAGRPRRVERSGLGRASSLVERSSVDLVIVTREAVPAALVVAQEAMHRRRSCAAERARSWIAQGRPSPFGMLRHVSEPLGRVALAVEVLAAFRAVDHGSILLRFEPPPSHRYRMKSQAIGT